jgi:hypothetical protein
MAGQRSNQLNYVPSLFSYRYWKPAYLLAFLTFNRFACVACFNPVEPNSEVNGHHGHQVKPPSNSAAGKHQPRAAVPAPRMNCSRATIDPSGFDPFAAKVILGLFVISTQHPATNKTFIAALDNALRVTLAMGALGCGGCYSKPTTACPK